MAKYIIEGGHRLNGIIRVDGAKNSILPILAATIINGSISILRDCPDLKDVGVMIEILESIGCKVYRDGSTITVNSSNISTTEIKDELVREMRSSIVVMGAMLARAGNVTISHPGGCDSIWQKRV